MSKLRPELITSRSGAPCPRGATAYLSIYNAVKGQTWGLIHGRLEDCQGHYCAVGSYFHAVDKGTALPTDVIDEVATVNDSCRDFTPKQRRNVVMRWLRWKLDQLGFPAYQRKSA
jgi:hypothetical protein